MLSWWSAANSSQYDSKTLVKNLDTVLDLNWSHGYDVCSDNFSVVNLASSNHGNLYSWNIKQVSSNLYVPGSHSSGFF